MVTTLKDDTNTQNIVAIIDTLIDTTVDTTETTKGTDTIATVIIISAATTIIATTITTTTVTTPIEKRVTNVGIGQIIAEAGLNPCFSDDSPILIRRLAAKLVESRRHTIRAKSCS